MLISSLNNRKAALVKLGEVLRAVVDNEEWPGYSIGLNEKEYTKFLEVLPLANSYNGWFSLDMVLKSLSGWSELLYGEKIEQWLSLYPSIENKDPKCVALICAGNIPMVAFHDVLCGYLCGHRLQIKLSSEDKVLIPAVVELISIFDQNILDQIEFVEGKIKDFDAVVATGSNNTSRYFQEYFGKYPHIIRNSRTSVAILDGTESAQDLDNLAKDVFLYYGLGCRNIKKLYIPEGYDLNNVFNGLFSMKDIINNNKYANNYDYYKAVFLLENYNILDNGFVLLKEDNSLFSPIGTLYYEFYKDKNDVELFLSENADQIQCRVGKNGIPFGKAQNPELWDYADEIDTINFFNNI